MRFGFLLLVFTVSSWATTFALQPIERQIKEADGIIMGHYLSSKSVLLDSGKVATQMIFKVHKEWGMQSDLFGLDEVIVHYPGGKWKDQIVEVQGVPSFVMGEKVALFTRNVDNRYWGHNLGFGTFKIVNYGNETMLVNTLFPNEPTVGQVKLEAFESKVRLIKGSNLKVVRQDFSEIHPGERSPASIDEGKKRSIASTSEQTDNREDQSTLSVYWLVAFLALAGGLARLFRARSV